MAPFNTNNNSSDETKAKKATSAKLKTTASVIEAPVTRVSKPKIKTVRRVSSSCFKPVTEKTNAKGKMSRAVTRGVYTEKSSDGTLKTDVILAAEPSLQRWLENWQEPSDVLSVGNYAAHLVPMVVFRRTDFTNDDPDKAHKAITHVPLRKLLWSIQDLKEEKQVKEEADTA